jgi:hypothetical protein
MVISGIGGYSISDYCWLLYYKPLVVILLMVIGSYYSLFYCRPLVVINGYFISGY